MDHLSPHLSPHKEKRRIQGGSGPRSCLRQPPRGRATATSETAGIGAEARLPPTHRRRVSCVNVGGLPWGGPLGCSTACQRPAPRHGVRSVNGDAASRVRGCRRLRMRGPMWGPSPVLDGMPTACAAAWPRLQLVVMPRRTREGVARFLRGGPAGGPFLCSEACRRPAPQHGLRSVKVGGVPGGALR